MPFRSCSMQEFFSSLLAFLFFQFHPACVEGIYFGLGSFHLGVSHDTR